MSIRFEVTSQICPLQIEGDIDDVNFYFHARGNSVYCTIGSDMYSPDFFLKQEVDLVEEGVFCSSQKVTLKQALEFVMMTYELSK